MSTSTILFPRSRTSSYCRLSQRIGPATGISTPVATAYAYVRHVILPIGCFGGGGTDWAATVRNAFVSSVGSDPASKAPHDMARGRRSLSRVPSLSCVSPVGSSILAHRTVLEETLCSACHAGRDVKHGDQRRKCYLMQAKTTEIQ